jgi:acetylornithine deacetylase/succinyl-diaminopimelate desuccinylase-like protein
VEGDKLYGRGTTDCLGHVGMITLLFKALAERRANLKRSVVALFIAGEEGGEAGVGVDMVVASSAIDELKNGTCYWIDSADSQPCTGTAGALQWHLKATGRLFHSGLPHRGINSFELVSEALKIIQDKFYVDFPPHEEEEKYGFATPSTMKPTQVECAKGALNQLPPWTTVSGDIRLTPFYDPVVVMETVNGYIKDINDNIESVPTRGPCSKYTLEGDDVDIKRGKVEIEWTDDESTVRQMEGIACDLNSDGLKSIIDATEEVKGEAKPYAITGSLPLVRQMQNEGRLRFSGMQHQPMFVCHANHTQIVSPFIICVVCHLLLSAKVSIFKSRVSHRSKAMDQNVCMQQFLALIVVSSFVSPFFSSLIFHPLPVLLPAKVSASQRHIMRTMNTLFSQTCKTHSRFFFASSPSMMRSRQIRYLLLHRYVHRWRQKNYQNGIEIPKLQL